MNSTEVFDSLRLTQAEVEQLIADLNRAADKSQATSRRALKRWPMQFQRSVLTTTSKLMGNMHGVAYPRNLAKKGAALLSGSFVHPGTACHLTLRAMDGKARSIQGTVRWCRHVKSRAHDLGIEFNAPINPRDFFIQQEGECLFQLERVEVTSLRGTILVVDEDRLTHRLFQDILGPSSVELVFAQNGEAGIKLLDQHPSLIVAENALPDMTGLDFLSKVRNAGFRTPLILMAREGDDELRLAAIGGGAQELLLRPVTPDTLLRGVAEYLSTESTTAPSPAKSAGAPPTDILLDLAKKALAEAENGDIEKAKSVLVRITTTAREFNLTALADQAGRAVAAAAGGASSQPRLIGEARGLVRACEGSSTKAETAA